MAYNMKKMYSSLFKHKYTTSNTSLGYICVEEIADKEKAIGTQVCWNTIK